MQVSSGWRESVAFATQVGHSMSDYMSAPSVRPLRSHRQPIFHEGSKGYLCCKRRVLDFDDFLSMPGCRTAAHSHLYAGPAAVDGEDVAEEHVECRVDHYQTPNEVIVSAFAKGWVWAGPRQMRSKRANTDSRDTARTKGNRPCASRRSG